MPRLTHLSAACVGVFFSVTLPVAAAPGDLDATFGTGGIVKTPVSVGRDRCWGVALQPDGKILASGYASNGADSDFALVRYLPNGALDASFGGTGQVTTPMGSSEDFGSAVAVMADGRIVLAGSVSQPGRWDFGAVRYLANGALDATFNLTGKAITDMGAASNRALDLAVLGDGRVVVAGRGGASSDGDFGLLRYRADGSLDATLNGVGTVVTAMNAGPDGANAVLVQEDGKILLAGYAGAPGSRDFALARYEATGGLDPSFGGTGKVITSIDPGEDVAADAVVQPDGKIVVVGTYGTVVGPIAVARYRADGTLDPTFNTTGVVKTLVNPAALAHLALAVALQADGKILVAGGINIAGTYRFLLLRYLPDGTLDTTFHDTGWVDTLVSDRPGRAAALAVQPDGKIVLAGDWLDVANTDFCLLRYEGGPFTPYEQWKIDSLSNVFAPDGGNGDGDAYVNLAEYGLVLDPAAYSPALPGGPHAYAEGTRLRMVFTRDPARSDVTIEAEVAGEMAGPWTTVASSVLGAPFTGAGYVGGDGAGAGLKTVEVRDTVNVGEPGSPSRFLRLRVRR